MEKKLAIVFPGQGSQTVGMISELAQDFPETKQVFEQASDVLGYDLWQLICAGPEDVLNLTEKTQPAMLAASVACWNIWNSVGGAKPEIYAGHSLGEYTALVAADAIQFSDAVKLVSLRGKYMQDTVAPGKGAMAAIVGLDDGRVEELCAAVSTEKDVVIPANYNSIGQVVIAGTTAAVEKVIALANDAGAKLAKILPVSVPCHCPLLVPASLELAEVLKSVHINKPAVPVINNVDVEFYHDAASIRDGLVRQLYSPVRWVETILKIQEQGINSIIECGPGKVLLGLMKRIDRNLKLAAIYSKDTITTGLNI